MNKTQLALLISYLNARARTARMAVIQMDGGSYRSLQEAQREEDKAMKALFAACPDAPVAVGLLSSPAPMADDDEWIDPPAEMDSRSATWPQRRMKRREARQLGLI